LDYFLLIMDKFIFKNNNFDSYSDISLFNLWNKIKLDKFERIYIYVELLKRNKIYL
jgi:hypothetical protein